MNPKPNNGSRLLLAADELESLDHQLARQARRLGWKLTLAAVDDFETLGEILADRTDPPT